MSLVEHAREELKRAGLFNTPEDKATSKVVLAMISTFARQKQRMATREQTLMLFDALIRGKNISPLTQDPEEWFEVTSKNNATLYQSKRNSCAFSDDNLSTYYIIKNSEEGAVREDFMFESFMDPEGPGYR